MNIFQRLLRHWDELHPYNAAQIFELRGQADAARLTAAFNEALADLRLGHVVINGNCYEHDRASSAVDVHVIPESQPLDEYVSRQMNVPFDRAGGCPFRPFVRNNGGSHYAGIIYHHWIADSSSIRLLMREWFLRLYDPTAARHTPVNAPRGGYWHHFGPGRSGWSLPHHVMRGISWQSRMKHVRRVEIPEFSDFRVRFSRHMLPDGLIAPLRRRARDLGVTVNDLFLGNIAQLSTRYVPMVVNRKRRDLALGTIINLRSASDAELDNAFGLFLGFSNVVLSPADLCDERRLLRAIAVQSRQQKLTHAAEASMLRFLAGVVAIQLMRHDRNRIVQFYRKRMPLAGGISNVNLNTDWPAKYHPDPLVSYIRVSPTGPMMPYVITPTTLGDTLHFGLTVRESLLPPDRAALIANGFAQALRQLA